MDAITSFKPKTARDIIQNLGLQALKPIAAKFGVMVEVEKLRYETGQCQVTFTFKLPTFEQDQFAQELTAYNAIRESAIKHKFPLDKAKAPALTPADYGRTVKVGKSLYTLKGLKPGNARDIVIAANGKEYVASSGTLELI